MGNKIKWPIDEWGNEFGYMGEPTEKIKYEVVLIEGRYVRIKDVVVHQFSMGDVDDPDIYAAQPLYDWEHSEVGQWVMEHAMETPTWHRFADMNTFGYKYVIKAKLKDVDHTFWALKWGTK